MAEQPSPSDPLVAAVILAAGMSSRMGRPKQLLPLGGRPVLQHVVDATAASGVGEVVVVLGHAATEVEAALRLPGGARVVVNPGYGAGQSTSLRTGLRALGPEIRAALVLLGDQPGIAPETIRALVETYRRSGGPVVRVTYGEVPGHPVILDRWIWPWVEWVSGDRGARELLAAHPDWVVPAEVPGDPPADLDTWEDYERLAGPGER